MEEHARTSMEQFIKYRESYKGKVMRGVLEKLNQIAKILLRCHDINCCLKSKISAHHRSLRRMSAGVSGLEKLADPAIPKRR